MFNLTHSMPGVIQCDSGSFQNIPQPTDCGFFYCNAGFEDTAKYHDSITAKNHSLDSGDLASGIFKNKIESRFVVSTDE